VKRSAIASLVLVVALSGCGGSDSSDGASPAGSPSALASKAMSADDLASLQSAVDAVIDGSQGELTSLLVGVWDPKKGVGRVASGKAVVSPERAASVDDQFRIGSITKTFVATLVLQAVADGTLELDKPVSDYAPDLAAKYPEIGSRTIRQLLSMRSGLPDFEEAVLGTAGSQPETTTKAWTADELMDAAMQAGKVTEPDTAPAVYNNTNFIVLGEVMRAVTGKELDALVSERLLSPLALSNTRYPLASDTSLTDPHSNGYIAASGVGELTAQGGTIEPGSDVTDWTASWGGAAGMMSSTIDDLGAWASADFGSALLPAELQKERSTFTELDVVGQYGLGLQKIGDWTGHLGGIPGWTTLLMRDRKTGVVVAMATNSFGDPVSEAHLLLLNQLYPESGVAEALIR
jgi:D-alanyl-D-alanine carboxypeptidase